MTDRIVKLNMDKMLNFSTELSLLANRTRCNIAEVLLKQKEQINISKLHNLVKEYQEVTYKVVAENIKMFADAGYVTTKKVKTKKGKEVQVKATEKLREIIQALFILKKQWM